MPFKPNYNQQRADRERAKQKKQQERLQKREEDAARRRAIREPTPPGNGEDHGEAVTNGADPAAAKPGLH
jgi:hypothetical protein